MKHLTMSERARGVATAVTRRSSPGHATALTPADCMHFCKVLRTGLASGPVDEPVILLRDYLVQTEKGRNASSVIREQYGKTERALKAHLLGESLSKLYAIVSASCSPFPKRPTNPVIQHKEITMTPQQNRRTMPQTQTAASRQAPPRRKKVAFGTHPAPGPPHRAVRPGRHRQDHAGAWRPGPVAFFDLDESMPVLPRRSCRRQLDIRLVGGVARLAGPARRPPRRRLGRIPRSSSTASPRPRNSPALGARQRPAGERQARPSGSRTTATARATATSTTRSWRCWATWTSTSAPAAT